MTLLEHIQKLVEDHNERARALEEKAQTMKSGFDRYAVNSAIPEHRAVAQAMRGLLAWAKSSEGIAGRVATAVAVAEIERQWHQCLDELVDEAYTRGGLTPDEIVNRASYWGSVIDRVEPPPSPTQTGIPKQHVRPAADTASPRARAVTILTAAIEEAEGFCSDRNEDYDAHERVRVQIREALALLTSEAPDV